MFRRVLDVARRGVEAETEFERVRVPDEPGSLSLLRDGTVLGPVHYFVPVGVVAL